MHLDRQLNWQHHHLTKRKQLGYKFPKMYWLIGKKLKLSLESKLLVNKVILKTGLLYGVQLWGTATASNIAFIQTFQSKMLRTITNGLSFLTNDTLHRD